MGYKRFQSGFKLIELLVVMAILILLAGMIWVATRSAQEGTARTQCMQNLRQIAIATYQYMIDYQAIYESSFFLANYLRASKGADAEKILICPRDRLFVPIQRTATSYLFVATDLTSHSPRRMLREHPNRVLFSCIHHFGLPLLRRGDWAGYDYQATPSWPFEIVLRLSGSVETIHSCRVRQVQREEQIEGRNVIVFSPLYPGEEGYEEATERVDYHWCR
jgi:type II secretory pathway pseudopilin PulG